MARILVVDDEKNVRKMVCLVLVRDWHEVEETEDGPQGLERFGDGAGWDMSLVDQRMPGMDGQAVIAEMRRRDPSARIVMITAFDSVQLASEVIQAGATDFLRKPFSVQTLRGAVAASLARPRQADTLPPKAPAHTADVPPTVSFWLNGYRYWPSQSCADGDTAAPPGLEVSRSFDVSGPFGESRLCVVGLTPHVCAQVRAAAGEPVPDIAPVWEVLCESALADYLWVSAEMPPEVVPLYDLTLAQMQIVTEMPRAS